MKLFKKAQAQRKITATIVVIILCVLLIAAFLYYIFKLKGRLAP